MEGAYINSSRDDLFSAVNSNNATLLQKLVKERDVNERDSVGRTPLMIAAFANSGQCAKILLQYGARISARMADGRTALHIAAAYLDYFIIRS
jgi:ankyrin repeat protein